MNALSLLQHAIVPLPTLPTEVIEEVIDQASDNPLSLRSLSLLCKDLLTRARIRLFTGIAIQDVEQMESSHEFLNSHPWVPPLVQRVTLSVEIDKDYSKPHIPLLDTIRLHLFSRLPNLHTWRMRASIPNYPEWSRVRGQIQLSFHPSTLLCYRTHGRHIQTLELSGIRFPDISHFIRFVSAFTSLRRLTCSDIVVQKELQTRLLDSEIIRKLSKPLRTEYLSVDASVDIRLVEYLLRASVATLNSFAMTISGGQPRTKDQATYFERLEEWIGQLSMLSSITLVLLLDRHPWFPGDNRKSLIQHIRWLTNILEHFRERKHLRDVRVQFELPTLSTLGCDGPRGGFSLKACTALEELLLSFPRSHVQFQNDRRQAGRVELWSLAMKSAFPKLDEQGRLTFPQNLTLRGHDRDVTSLVASPNSKLIVTGSLDGTIIIWNAEEGTIMYEWLAHWGRVDSLSFSPDSRQLVSTGGRSGGTLVIWDLSDGVHKLAILAHTMTKNSTNISGSVCSWPPDGKLIASTCQNGPVRIWDVLTFQQRNLLPLSASNPSQKASIQHWSSFHWTSDSHYLVWEYTTSKGNGRNCNEWAIWSPHIAEPPQRFPPYPACHVVFGIRKIVFDPEMTRIAIAQTSESRASGEAGTSDGHSRCILPIWEIIESGTKLVVLELDTTEVEDLSFSPDGQYLLSIDETRNNFKIWDTDSWQITASLEGDGGVLSRVCFSPNGKYVAAVSNDARTDIYRVRLWRIGENLCTAVFIEHKSPLYHLAFSPNGEFLASGDEDGIVHIRRLSDFIEH